MNPRDAGAYLNLGEVCRSEGRLPEAEAALQKALELEPQNGWVHCQLGRVYRKQGRAVNAEAALKKALELEPENGCARVELGVLYQDQGGLVAAAVEFEKAIAIDRNNGWAHYELGKIYRRQGRWPEAEAALHKALESHPQNEGARLELGALYLEQDRLAEAATEFKQAMAKDRNNGWAYFQLGRVCRRQGRLPEAEAALHEALELDPQNGCAHIELGALYEDQNRLMPAAAEFEKAIAMDPNNGWAHCQLGRIYRKKKRLPEAEAALHKALEFDLQNEAARLELGALYLEQDRLAEAATEFEQAMAKDRNNGWAYFQLGRACRRQGRLPEAETALHEALELDPQNGGAHIELGALYEDQNRLMPAAAELEKAIAMDPNNGWAHCQLGRIYRKKKRLPEAEAAFKTALAIDPRVDGVCIELGVLYKDQDRLAEAEAAFQKAIACGPRNGEAHVHLGNVYRRQGRWGEAEAEFNAAIAIDPRQDRAFMGLWAIYSSQGRTAEAAAAVGKASAMNSQNAWARITLPERLDLDKAVSADAAQGRNGPAGMNATLLPSLAQDVSKELKRERVFCLLPWTHLHIRTNGLSLPCCAWSGPPLGNVRSSSIAELWNSPGMKAVRLDMMSGRPVSGCSACYENEESGFLSTRQRSNIELGCHRGRERLTAADGALPRLPVPLLDIRFSNICNLRCRTCDTTQSSAWMVDAQALGLPVKGGPSHKPFADWDSLWRELQPLLEDGLEEIRFVGGEPLLMEEHYRILDFLIARKLTDVRLNYTTNFSALRYQGRDVVDLWTRFRNVHVAASLDGSGRRGEYLRKGLRWDTVEANREEMLRRCPDVKFSISVTVSIFNALHLPDFHREWSKKGYIERDEFALNMLVAPAIYQAQALPPALKRRVLEAYRRHRESFLDAAEPAARDFTAAARFLEAQDRSELLPEFVAMTRRLDALRGEDCREVFPELAALFEAAA